MINALTIANQAVIEARHEIHELLVSLPAPTADKARTLLDTLELAVRHHDAELILEQCPTHDSRFAAGVDWAADTIRHA